MDLMEAVAKKSITTPWKRARQATWMPETYLDCEESDVAKLLVESSNLFIINPGLVLCARLEEEKPNIKLRWCYKFCRTSHLTEHTVDLTFCPSCSTNHWSPRKLQAISVSPL